MGLRGFKLDHYRAAQQVADPLKHVIYSALKLINEILFKDY
jgi:hypothetical protein